MATAIKSRSKSKVPPFWEVVDNGKNLRLNFHAGQSKAMDSTADWVCVICGSQWGKTELGPCWLHREIQKCGPGDYLAVTATYPLLRQKMLPILIRFFQSLVEWGEWKAADKVFESYDRIHGGPASRIIVGSATNPESLESATAKAAWLDECGQHQFTRAAWEAVQRRLTVNEGRVLITTTPYEFGWFKSDVYDRAKAGADYIEIIHGDSIDNPVFPAKAYERARDTLPLWKFNMFHRGIFEKPAGLIYDCFDEATAVIPRFVIPSNWPRYVGHDFGPNNTAAVWYAQDPGTGYLYLYREYHEGGLSAYDHAQKFKKLSEGETIIKRVGGANHEDGWRESFTAAGWPISKPREHEVEAGINLVYGWHQQGKLFVFKDCQKYLDEKLTYSRVLDDNYEPTEKIDNKSKFHELDAERYILSDFGPERDQTNLVAPVIYHGLSGGPRRSRRLMKVA